MTGWFADITLAEPAWLLLALLVPGAALLRRHRGAPSILFAPAAFLEGRSRMPRSWRVRLLPLPRVLTVVGLLLVVVALARPVRRVALPLERRGIDIMLCLDTSSSMRATDMDAERTRLAVAKEAARRFIAARPGDRIGLVTFARFPDVRCPPTPDHEALKGILAATDVVADDDPEDATGIGTAVARATQVLRSSSSPSKVVILLTDGEENVATEQKPDEIAPVHAGQLGKELGVRVYAISAGQGTRRSAGEWVTVDTTQVRTLAESTGGRFFTARDADGVASVYDEIDTLEQATFEEQQFEVQERFWSILALAIAAVLAAHLLGSSIVAVLP